MDEESRRAAAPRFRASPRLNFSLCHAGLQQAVAEWDSPVAAEVRVAGCSDVLAVPAGRRDGFTPPLNAFHLSRLDAPVATELIVVKLTGSTWRIRLSSDETV